MSKVVIVSAVRTPIGRFGGCFKMVKPIDLMNKVVLESLNRVNLKPEVLGQVIIGNNFGHIEQNIARLATLTIGYPEWEKFPYNIPGYTVNCACTSAAQAIILGYNAIKMGQVDVVMAGGVESMSQAPYLMENVRWGMRMRHEIAYDVIWKGMQEYPIGGGMGLAAERLATKYKMTRKDLDELALSSHRRGCAAIKEGKFKKEIVPFEVKLGRGKTQSITTDEGPREDTTLEALGQLPPAFKEGGVVTAGNASQMNDGAAMVIMMTEEKAKEYGLSSLGEILAVNYAAVDPLLVGIAPVPAVKRVLSDVKRKIKDVQIFEINEAFASFYIASEIELGLNREITNVNGSGISVGHPVGATGTRMVVTMLYEMERRGLNLGVSALCGGSGVGTAILIERK